jgi:hypothetical protein
VAWLNANLVHRPLRAGCAIINPVVNEIGTLGFVATSDGNDRWIVSCYHVLCRSDLSPPADGEHIFQPVDDNENWVANASIERSDQVLDCAAALVIPDVSCTGEILGLPRLSGTAEPEVGMRVMKSGCITGITEGVITAVARNIVTIAVVATFPPTSQLSEPGDSGSLWVDRRGLNAVALHRTGSAFGETLATAVRISVVIETLRLKPLFE